jgi:hypothetical protein
MNRFITANHGKIFTIGILHKEGKDDNNIKYPIITIKNDWKHRDIFLDELSKIENVLDCSKNKDKKNEKIECKYCNKKLNKKTYEICKIVWYSYLKHYIKHHNYYPPKFFVKFVLNIIPSKNLLNKKVKPKCLEYLNNNSKYLFISRNDLRILDALMEFGGGVSKKFFYYNKKKYSETSGYFIIDNDNLEVNSISVFDSERNSKSDDEILLPKNSKRLENYKIIYHTHPPTPKPGSRIKNGILYEFPSLGDIIHFMNSYKKQTRYSLIMCPEGLYIIRSLEKPKLEFKNEIIKKYNSIISKIQNQAIKKYYDPKMKFYEEVAQDKTFIKKLNKFLNKYNLQVDYYPRNKIMNKWIVDNVYIKLN